MIQYQRIIKRWEMPEQPLGRPKPRGIIHKVKRAIFRRMSKLLVLLTGHGDDRSERINNLHHKLSYRLFKFSPYLGIESVETIHFTTPAEYSLCYDARDGGVGHKFLMYGEYEPFATRVVASLLTSESAVWNIGANLGYYTLLASHLAKRVRAFEPHPDNVQLLIINVALDAAVNVDIEPIALSDESGEISFFESETNSGDHRLIPEDGRLVRRVKALAAKEAIAAFGLPDTIIMDVQGAEGKIMRSLRDTLRNKSVSILMEFWPDGLARAGSSAQEIESILIELDYHVWIVSESMKLLIPVQPGTIALGMKANEEINLLCLPAGSELPAPLQKLLFAP